MENSTSSISKVKGVSGNGTKVNEASVSGSCGNIINSSIVSPPSWKVVSKKVKTAQKGCHVTYLCGCGITFRCSKGAHQTCRSCYLHLVKSVPAPRLVGIEPNPGPDPKNNKSKINNKKQKQNNKKNNNNNSKAKKKVKVPKAPLSNTVTSQYLKTLADPFEYSGVPLGFGALVPTRISTIYLRGSVASNADGSLALAAYPQAANFLGIANGGAAVSFATSADFITATDYTAISANIGSGRLVSLGLKAYPNLAATSVPGEVVCGAVPGSNTTLFNALTPNDLVSFPTSHIGRGYEGAVSCSRPQDTDSYEFYQQMVNSTGFTGTTQFPCSIPYIAFSGIGNATLVYYELQANIEYIEILQHSSAGMGMGALDNSRTLAAEWDSLEHMWSSVKVRLPDPGRIGYDTLSGFHQSTPAIMENGGRLNYGGQLRNNRRN
jgi:hypothetical protein